LLSRDLRNVSEWNEDRLTDARLFHRAPFAALMLGVATFWAMRTARLRAVPLDAAYDALCTKLARIGAPRGDSEGPLDYASRLRSAPPLSDRCAVEVQRLFAEYVGLRYARAFPTGEGIAGFARDVYRLRLETRN